MNKPSTGEPMPPLVSIGIPTRNRLHSLQRALESTLRQDYRPLEIVISDNASEDGTAEFCLRTARGNPTVKYYRQPHNQGMLENFRQVLNRASGHFFMWLADDDWLEPNYVSECVKFLLAHPDYVLVGGTTRKQHSETGVFYDQADADLELSHENGPERVLAFHRQLGEMNIFYGIMPRRLIKRKIGAKSHLGVDVLMVSSLVFTGKIKTLRTTTLYRDLHGSTWTVRGRLKAFNQPAFFNQNYFYTAIGLNVLKDIIFSGKYGSLQFLPKCRLAFQVFLILSRKFNFPGEIKKTPVLRLPYRWFKRRLPAFRRAPRKIFLTKESLPK